MGIARGSGLRVAIGKARKNTQRSARVTACGFASGRHGWGGVFFVIIHIDIWVLVKIFSLP